MVLCIGGCHYTHRFNRLLKNHPDLKALVSRDTIVVDDGETKDTILVFQKDTITIEGIRIIRGNMDSIRIIAHERPCTTFVREVIVQPAKTKSEQRRYWKQEKYKTKKQSQVAKVEARHSITKGMFLFMGLFMGIFIGLIIKPRH
jgi:hypothetical protein